MSLSYISDIIFLFAVLNSASVVEESFEYLDAPVERIAGADVCMPYAANLERLAVPQVCISDHSSGSLDNSQENRYSLKDRTQMLWTYGSICIFCLNFVVP